MFQLHGWITEYVSLIKSLLSTREHTTRLLTTPFIIKKYYIIKEVDQQKIKINKLSQRAKSSMLMSESSWHAGDVIIDWSTCYRLILLKITTVLMQSDQSSAKSQQLEILYSSVWLFSKYYVSTLVSNGLNQNFSLKHFIAWFIIAFVTSFHFPLISNWLHSV